MATLIPQVNGSLIGDMTSFGGRGAAFDGTTSKAAAASAGTSGSPARCYVGKDWGSGVSHLVSEFKVWGPNNGAMAGNASGTVQLYGSNSAPASATDGTLLYSGASSGASAETQDVTAGITVTTAYRFHWVGLTLGGGNNGFLAQVQFYENSSATLTPSAAAYTLTGVAAGLNKGKLLVAVAAAYTLSGVSVVLNRGLRLVAAVAPFTLTGIAATVGKAISLVATKATFVLTGIAHTGVRGLGIAANTAVFALTGVAQILARNTPAQYARRRLSDFGLTTRRAADPSLQKRRATDPSLGD